MPNTSKGNTLQPGQSLHRGEYLLSANGRYQLILQDDDGNLVLYRLASTGNTPLWATAVKDVQHSFPSFAADVRVEDARAFCNGQLLNINQNQALFSILGTTCGGNGTTTFALPDLRGRVPVGAGPGPGLSNHSVGEQFGQESVTLTTAQLPPHTHQLQGSAAGATSPDPTGLGLAQPGDPVAGDGTPIYGPLSPPAAMAAGSISAEGGGQAHANTQPSLGLNYIICLNGVFPSRD